MDNLKNKNKIYKIKLIELFFEKNPIIEIINIYFYVYYFFNL